LSPLRSSQPERRPAIYWVVSRGITWRHVINDVVGRFTKSPHFSFASTSLLSRVRAGVHLFDHFVTSRPAVMVLQFASPFPHSLRPSFKATSFPIIFHYYCNYCMIPTNFARARRLCICACHASLNVTVCR